MNKCTKITELLESSWQLEQQFMNEQPMEERENPGTLEKGSRKDVIAHIETWNERLAENIRKSLRGETLRRSEDFNAENKIIFETHQANSWHQVIGFAALAHQNLIDAVALLGDAGLERTDLLPWQSNQPIWRNIVGNAYSHALIHIGEHYREHGDLEMYISYLEKIALEPRGLDDSPAWQGTARYNLACAHALRGEIAKALEELRDALRLNPGLTEWSREDPDLESLRGEPAYQALYKT